MFKKSQMKAGVGAAALSAAMLLEPHFAAAQEQDSEGAFTETIVVTARKKAESTFDAPLAVTGFTGFALEERSIDNLADLALFTPGFSFESYASGNLSTPVIRGLTQTSLTLQVQNVSTFVDGIYLQNGVMVDLGFFDVQQVEILRGPQSALQGRNSFSGAIAYTTKRPTEELTAEFLGVIGTDERYEVRGALSGPIIEDKLLARVSAGFNKFDGTWENNFPTADVYDARGTNGNLGGRDDWNISASLTFRPFETVEIQAGWLHTELFREQGPSYNLSGIAAQRFGVSQIDELNAGFTDSSITTFFGTPLAGFTFFEGTLPTDPPGQGVNRPVGIGSDPRSVGLDSNSDIYRASLDWDITENWSFNYLFGKVELDAVSAGDSLRDSTAATGGAAGPFGSPTCDDGTPLTNGNCASFDGSINGFLDSTSHEARVRYADDRLNAMVGVFYSKLDDIRFAQGFQPGLEGLEPLDFVNQPVARPTAFFDEIFAVFASAEYEVTEKFTVSAEARYTWEDKRAIISTSNNIGITRGNYDPFDPTIPSGRDLSEDFTYFTPRVILQYRPNDQFNIYASVAKGVKAGGFNAAEDPIQNAYEADDNWTFELGVKGQLLDGRATFDAAVYYVDWSNLQASEAQIDDEDIPNSPFNPNSPLANVIGNQTGATAFGFEASGAFQLTDSLIANGSFSWVRPKYKDGSVLADIESRGYCTGAAPNPNFDSTDRNSFRFTCPGNPGDIGGNRLQRTPTVNAAFGLGYNTEVTDEMDFFARGDLTYQNGQFLTALNLGKTPSRTLVNAQAGLRGEWWSANVYVKNLFNERYAANSLYLFFVTSYVVGLGPQREAGLQVSLNY